MTSRLDTPWSIAHDSGTDNYTLTYASGYGPVVVAGADFGIEAHPIKAVVVVISHDATSRSEYRFDKCTSPLRSSRATLITAIQALRVTGDLTITGNLSVAGTSTLTGAVAAGATLGVTGASTLTGAVAAADTLAVTGITTATERLRLTPTATVPATPAAGDVYIDDGTNTLSGTGEMRYYNGTTWIEPRQAMQMITLNVNTPPNFIFNATSTTSWATHTFTTAARTHRSLGPSMWSVTPAASSAGTLLMTCDVGGEYHIEVVFTCQTSVSGLFTFMAALKATTATDADISATWGMSTSGGAVHEHSEVSVVNHLGRSFSATDTLQLWRRSSGTTQHRVMGMQIKFWRL